MANQQAEELMALIEPYEYIESEEISISKENFKKFYKGALLAVDKKYLKVDVFKDGQKINSAKLYAKEGYVYIKLIKSCSSKRDKISKKVKLFKLRYNISLYDGMQKILLAKMPLEMRLRYKKKSLAVELFIKERIYIRRPIYGNKSP